MDNKLKELITKYNIRLRGSNDLALNKKPNDTDLQFIKDNKDNFVTYIQNAEIQKEKEEKEKEENEIRILTSGWESHVIFIDLRQDVDTQLKKYAEIYSNDCTIKSLKEDFKKALSKKEVAKKEVEETEVEEKNIFETAKITNTKQILNINKEYIETDIEYKIKITIVYAQPNGTVTTKINIY